jgi:hypothetical protein
MFSCPLGVVGLAEDIETRQERKKLSQKFQQVLQQTQPQYLIAHKLLFVEALSMVAGTTVGKICCTKN